MVATEVQLSQDERSAILERVVTANVQQGWRVVSQTQTQAQLVKGKPTNHLLHLILSLVTLGIWIPVWIAVAIFAGEKQKFVQVDTMGRVL